MMMTFDFDSVASVSWRENMAQRSDKWWQSESNRTNLSSLTLVATSPTKTSIQSRSTGKDRGVGLPQVRLGIVISPSGYKLTSAQARLRQVVEEAQGRLEMFAKVPKQSYSNPTRGGQPGLLSQLFKASPSAIAPGPLPHIVLPQPDLAQRSRRGQAAMFPTHKSSAAVPLITEVTAEAAAVPLPAREEQKLEGPFEDCSKAQGMMDTKGYEQLSESTASPSRSLAHESLAALAHPTRRRQHSDCSPHPHTVQISTPWIQLNHGCNLSIPAAPMTPRTARRQMLQTELSESLRRNLLWERCVSRPHGAARRASIAGNGSRPTISPDGLSGSPDVGETEERRRRVLERCRSWAHEYHYSGW